MAKQTSIFPAAVPKTKTKAIKAHQLGWLLSSSDVPLVEEVSLKIDHTIHIHRLLKIQHQQQNIFNFNLVNIKENLLLKKITRHN